MPSLAQEFRDALSGAKMIVEDHSEQRIVVHSQKAWIEFNWKPGITRYPDETSRQWRKREAKELPLTTARQLVGEWFDGDEYQSPQS